jgi:hypothetical protein
MSLNEIKSMKRKLVLTQSAKVKVPKFGKMTDEKQKQTQRLRKGVSLQIKCKDCKRALPRGLFLDDSSICCSDCSAIKPKSSEPPLEEFDTIGRFVMHESLREFPVLVEALEVVSFFLDTTDFENCVNHFLCQIACNPLNRYSERLVHLDLVSLWTEDDHSFVKDVIAGIKEVQVVGGCEKKDYMQSDRKENTIFVQEQWQRTLSGDTLFVANIAKLIHEVAHLIAAKLICYANSLPYTPEQNTPPKLGTKRKIPIQGDAGNFIEEFLFGGRLIPKHKTLILEAEDYSSAWENLFQSVMNGFAISPVLFATKISKKRIFGFLQQLWQILLCLLGIVRRRTLPSAVKGNTLGLRVIIKNSFRWMMTWRC